MIDRAKQVQKMSDEVLMETVYLGEQDQVNIDLYDAACEELRNRGLAGDPYCAFVEWYNDYFFPCFAS